MSLNPSESEAITRISGSGRRPVVLVHGLWLLASSWRPWEQFLEEQGYAPLSVDWPNDPETVQAARNEPQALAGTTVSEAADHLADVVASLDRRPVVIGHSLGGLLAQIVAGRGLNAATVAISPAPFKGILSRPASTLRASFPVLRTPANRQRAVTLTPAQFNYAFANALDEADAAAIYETHHVAAAGRPLFELATANVSWSSATAVDRKNPERGPLLLIGGSDDHTVPMRLVKAAYKKQSRNPGVTEIVEIEGAGHSLVVDANWSKTAAKASTFLTRNGLTP